MAQTAERLHPVFDPTLSRINVIQAAAPDGVSGTVNVNAPVFDVAGSLRGLSAELIGVGALAKDLCQAGAGSSLTPIGRGGWRPAATGMIRPERAARLAAARPAEGERGQAIGSERSQVAGIASSRDYGY